MFKTLTTEAKILAFVTIFASVVFFYPRLTEAETVDSNNNDSLLQQIKALTNFLEQLQNQNQTPTITDEELKKSILAGTDWILRSQENNGHFKYEYVPYQGIYNNDDNIVRQAGSLYVLGEVYSKQTVKDPNLAVGIEKSIDYFISATKDSDPDDGDFSCVSDPATGSRDCKLGATSLVLLGILSYVDGAPEQKNKYKDLIEDYVAYIMAAKKPDAGFRNVYKIGIAWQSKESSFSNGEALLALVRYYQYQNDEKVKKVIDDSFDYMKNQEYDSNLYLWIMAALKDMQRLWPKDVYVNYTLGFTNWRVNRAAFQKRTSRNYCAYAEGLASAYSILDGEIEPYKLKNFKTELNFWNTRNYKLQVSKDNKYKVATIDGKLEMVRLSDYDSAVGGFLTAHDELIQRIDFTQHCISAYLQTAVDINDIKL